MDSFYIKIDTPYLNTLDPEVRNELEKRIQSQPNITTYIRMCPYCNYIYLVSIAPDSENDLETCLKCGRSDPFDKIKLSTRKNHSLQKLLDCKISDDTGQGKRETERVLLEQCIVNFATGIEQFFREFYAIWMNLRFVKCEQSLYDKFYEDAGNDFLNTGKWKQRFKDLELTDDSGNIIDITTEFTLDLKKLNTIMRKRHAIVHNNGLADKKYNEQVDGGNKGELGKEIPISTDEINECFSTIDSITAITKNIYDRFCRSDFEKNIDTRIKKDKNVIQFLSIRAISFGVGHANVTLSFK
jgi:hypothetical protein